MTRVGSAIDPRRASFVVRGDYKLESSQQVANGMRGVMHKPRKRQDGRTGLDANGDASSERSFGVKKGIKARISRERDQ